MANNLSFFGWRKKGLFFITTTIIILSITKPRDSDLEGEEHSEQQDEWQLLKWHIR